MIESTPNQLSTADLEARGHIEGLAEIVGDKDEADKYIHFYFTQPLESNQLQNALNYLGKMQADPKRFGGIEPNKLLAIKELLQNEIDSRKKK